MRASTPAGHAPADYRPVGSHPYPHLPRNGRGRGADGSRRWRRPPPPRRRRRRPRLARRRTRERVNDEVSGRARGAPSERKRVGRKRRPVTGGIKRTAGGLARLPSFFYVGKYRTYLRSLRPCRRNRSDRMTRRAPLRHARAPFVYATGLRSFFLSSPRARARARKRSPGGFTRLPRRPVPTALGSAYLRARTHVCILCCGRASARPRTCM